MTAQVCTSLSQPMPIFIENEQCDLSADVVQVALEEARQGPLLDRLKAIDAVNLEKKRDLTAAGLQRNREGNKGTVAGHD